MNKCFQTILLNHPLQCQRGHPLMSVLCFAPAFSCKGEGEVHSFHSTESTTDSRRISEISAIFMQQGYHGQNGGEQ